MITEYLAEKDKSFVVIPEISAPLNGFTMVNSGGVECQVGEFLYGLIRVLRPDNVLETGTHYAVGASYMGQALKDNGSGLLTTLEFIPEIHQQASLRIDAMGLGQQVECKLIDAANFQPDRNYQLILLDTEPQTRFAELMKFFPYLNKGGYIFIHDLHRHMAQVEQPNVPEFGWPFGVLPKQIKDWVNDGELRPFHLPTPRGLVGFYKPMNEDYPWL